LATVLPNDNWTLTSGCRQWTYVNGRQTVRDKRPQDSRARDIWSFDNWPPTNVNIDQDYWIRLWYKSPETKLITNNTDNWLSVKEQDDFSA